MVDRIDLSELGITSFGTVQGTMGQSRADTSASTISPCLIAGDFIFTSGSAAIVAFDAGGPHARGFEPELERPQSIRSIATPSDTAFDTI